jgi:protein-tyrosine phosphatase
MKSVLFVCLGNICRSPAAEEIFRKICEENHFPCTISSCGMGDWHLGGSPDTRMHKAAMSRGIHMKSRAKLMNTSYFDEFDYIIAVDHEILRELYKHATKPEYKAKVHLLSNFSETYKGQDIPDPYYQGEAGFELVLDMLDDCCQGFFKELSKN